MNPLKGHLGRLRRPRRPGRQLGVGAVEFIFAGALITVIGTVALQYTLMFNAKSMVSHASFMAARAGSMHHAQLPAIQDAYERALVPLYGGGRDSAEIAQALARARADTAGHVRIELLNPTHESFDDWADAALAIKYAGQSAIRNANLGLRDRGEIGAASGQNIQDANLIKIKITHGYPLSVPFAGQLMQKLMSWSDSGSDAFATQLYAQKRIPIVTHATVQMQSDPVESGVLVSMPGAGNGGVPTDPGMPEVGIPPFPECLTAGCSVVAEPGGPGTGGDDPLVIDPNQPGEPPIHDCPAGDASCTAICTIA